MKKHDDLFASKAITLVQRTGKPDLLKNIVGLFKSESRKFIAALQQGMDSSDLKASIAALVRHVSTPA